MPKFNFGFKPLECRKVEKALLNLGFIEEAKKATSHRQFRKISSGRLYKVTFDCHRGEVSALNVKSIIKQSGVSKKVFFDALNS